MPRVSIGVPVFNGSATLQEALTDLREQTFSDFEVLIFDNASTDRTAEIAKRFCEIDHRFKYFRHEHNKPWQDNFLDCLHAASAPYFMWRADDDVSTDNFIEVLVDILDKSPNAGLAVSDGKWIDYTENYEKNWPVQDTAGQSLFRMFIWQTRRISPHWWYGLYRTDFLRQEIGGNWLRDEYISDMAFLAYLMSTGRVASKTGAKFYFRRLNQKIHRGRPFDYKMMMSSALTYWNQMNNNLNELPIPFYQRPIIKAFFIRMIDRKLIRFKSIYKAWRLASPVEG